jgi:hypothetical protein
MAGWFASTEQVQMSILAAMDMKARERFGRPIPNRMRIDVRYHDEMQAYMLRVSWPAPGGKEFKCLDVMVNDKTLYYHNSSDLMPLVDLIFANEAFVCGVFAGMIPEQIARQIRNITRNIRRRTLDIHFHNGHKMSIRDSEQLSDYDHANLLMVYDLPPL